MAGWFNRLVELSIPDLFRGDSSQGHRERLPDDSSLCDLRASAVSLLALALDLAK
jgi:hypothetical protein